VCVCVFLFICLIVANVAREQRKKGKRVEKMIA